MEIFVFPSELIIRPEEPVPVYIQDKILKYHINPVNRIRQLLGVPVWASKNSGYRSKAFERERGRDPEASSRKDWSRHTFEPCPDDVKGKGAVDWTTRGENIVDFALALYCMTDYMRLAWYGSFIHADYKGGERQLVIGDGWQIVSLTEWIQQIESDAG